MTEKMKKLSYAQLSAIFSLITVLLFIVYVIDKAEHFLYFAFGLGFYLASCMMTVMSGRRYENSKLKYTPVWVLAILVVVLIIAAIMLLFK